MKRGVGVVKREEAVEVVRYEEAAEAVKREGPAEEVGKAPAATISQLRSQLRSNHRKFNDQRKASSSILDALNLYTRNATQ